MTTPLVTIILCTRNRATDLRETLASIAGLDVPSDLPTELLLVDNGSFDRTREIATSANLPNMPLRYVIEPRPGKGHAYNKALSEARGSIYLFTDDDVRIPRDWIERMCRPILLAQADATLGSTRMAEHLRRPWMRPVHLVWLTDCDYSKATDPQGLIGANMALSRKVFDTIGGFDTNLGPGALGFCEDTLLAGRALAAGFTIRGAGDVFIEHHFDPARLSRQAFLDRTRRQGQSSAYLAYHWHHQPIRFPLLRWIMYSALLMLHRLPFIFRPPPSEGATERELVLVEKAAWNLQYARERRLGPRRYKHGPSMKSQSPAIAESTAVSVA